MFQNCLDCVSLGLSCQGLGRRNAVWCCRSQHDARGDLTSLGTRAAFSTEADELTTFLETPFPITGSFFWVHTLLLARIHHGHRLKSPYATMVVRAAYYSHDLCLVQAWWLSAFRGLGWGGGFLLLFSSFPPQGLADSGVHALCLLSAERSLLLFLLPPVAARGG